MPALLETESEYQTLLLRRKAELLRRKLQLVKENGIYFYTPWEKQDLFHRAAATSKFRLFQAGNRTGKSTAASAEVGAYMLGERPWYKRSFTITDRAGNVIREHDGYDNHPYVRAGIPQRPLKILLITTDWDKVSEIWTSQENGSEGKLFQLLPKGFIRKVKRNHAGAIDRVYGENGAVFIADTVKSFMLNPQGSESADYDVIFVDEPVPEAMWKATSRGLVDRNGVGVFTLTPLKERWISDMFFPSPGAPTDSIPENRWACKASMWDNPYLTEEAIQEYVDQLTEEERQCRIDGIPLELSGLVYKEFDYSKHVLQKVPEGWTDFWSPPEDYVVSFAIDPHPQTPHAVLFLAVAPTGQKFIYDEIYVQTTPDILCNEIKKRLSGRRLHHRKCDPIAWINDPLTGSCLAEAFMREGVWVDKASKAKGFGILQARRELSRENNLYVNPRLNRFLFEINRYCYDKENKPIDKDDHMMENMYRLFLNELRWFDSTNKSQPIEDIEITGSRSYDWDY